MSMSLSTLDHRYSTIIIPATGFLDNPLALMHGSNLALDFVSERSEDRPKRVQILDLDLCSECLATASADRYISVASKRSLFHISAAHSEVPQNRSQGHEILPCQFGRADIRIADDLHQGNACPIDIDQRSRRHRLRVGTVSELGGVFFEMHSLDSNAEGFSRVIDFEPTTDGDRMVILRNLEAFQ